MKPLAPAKRERSGWRAGPGTRHPAVLYRAPAGRHAAHAPALDLGNGPRARQSGRTTAAKGPVSNGHRRGPRRSAAVPSGQSPTLRRQLRLRRPLPTRPLPRHNGTQFAPHWQELRRNQV